MLPDPRKICNSTHRRQAGQSPDGAGQREAHIRRERNRTNQNSTSTRRDCEAGISSRESAYQYQLRILWVGAGYARAFGVLRRGRRRKAATIVERTAAAHGK